MHVLGINGGGTLTRAAIMSETGKIISVGSSGASSIDTVSLQMTRRSITEAVYSALNRTGEPLHIKAIHCCIGGIVSSNDKMKVNSILKELPVYNDSCIICSDNDMKAAWSAGNLLDPCIVLILNTGSVAYGNNGSDTDMKSGGWGYREGDPGSAYDLGISAIRYMVRAYDGRMNPTPLIKHIFNNLGLTTVNDITSLLYQREMTRTEIASLAPTVTEYAEKGDAAAVSIINRSLCEAVEMVRAVYTGIFNKTEILCSISGSLGNSGGYYTNKLYELITGISNKIRVAPIKVEPVFGACLLALRYTGEDTGEAVRAMQKLSENRTAYFSSLYPLKLNKTLFEKVWGGNAFYNIFGIEADGGNYGELWEVSANKQHISIIQNGFLTGKNLLDVLSQYKTDLVGQRVLNKFGELFPILVKYLDVNDRLSVQVHPDDTFAELKENSNGKAEIWYILRLSN